MPTEDQMPGDEGFRGSTDPYRQLLARAQASPLCRSAIRTLAGDLPRDDARLNALLGAAVEQRLDRAFTVLALGAVSVQRKVDELVVVAGAGLLPGFEYIVFVARGCSDAHGCPSDLKSILLSAVRAGHIAPGTRELVWIAAFLLSAESVRSDADFPPIFAELARHAREDGTVPWALETAAWLVSKLAGTPPARPKLKSSASGQPPQLVSRIKRALVIGLPALIPEDESGWASSARRRLPRVARNQPCSCGSGLKAKRCCLHKTNDMVTSAEEHSWSARPRLVEADLTAARAADLTSHELAHLDPRQVPAAMHVEVIRRLAELREFEILCRYLTELDSPPELDGALVRAINVAARARHRDAVHRLAALRTVTPPDGPALSLTAKLMVGDPGAVLGLLEAEARRCIDGSTDEFAIELLLSQVPALGILVARGALTSLHEPEADHVSALITLVRARLDLTAPDPVLACIEERAEKNSALVLRTLETLDEVNRQRADMVLQVEQLQRRTVQLQADLATARDTAAAATKVSSSARGLEEELVQSRRKCQRLEVLLREAKDENRTLRNDLSASRTEPVRFRVETAEDGHDVADDDTDPADVPTPSAPRIPEFSTAVVSEFGAVPRCVAATCLERVGQLAAGRSSAYRSTKRLRADVSLLATRVGDHRLLFRVRPNALEVVALVHRRELQRWLDSWRRHRAA
jgi:hypothetical protein